MALVDFSLIESFEAWAKKLGMQAASTQVLEELMIGPIQIKGSFPKSGPLLIISNHPGGLDSFTLLAAILRNDFYLTALVTYQIFGPTFVSQLLPIYRHRNWRDIILEFFLGLNGKPGRENFHPEKVRELNRATIRKAAQLISEGNAVSIFPTGSVGKKNGEGRWKVGVGHLVQQISNDKTQVVFVKIEGAGKSDLGRLANPWLRKKLFSKRKRTVLISEAMSLVELVQGCETAKDVAGRLERKHNLFFF